MSDNQFVHLHVHTQYSLLDGAIRLPDLISTACAYNMPAVAITDHGNMFGAIEFYQQAQAAGIKPIIGCETYVAPASRYDKEYHRGEETNYHLVLLAINQTGYQNLSALVTAGHFEGFYYKPRIDKELLARHNEGLIALSACLQGEIPAAIRSGDMSRALALSDEYRSLFDDGRFYLELQDNGIDDQRVVNEGLREISKQTGIPVVATNDCHYLRAEDAQAHEVLLCIQTGKTMSAPDRMRMPTREFYLKSPEEMQRAFSHLPEALRNTLVIAERCAFDMTFKDYKFPHFTPPQGCTNDAFFEQQVREGLESRLQVLRSQRPEEIAALEPRYRERMESEIGMIRKMNFTTYFLIVSDFIRHAKHNGCPVGPGRGSAAGSLVAYALEITEIDPIQHDLLFERFLNPERVNPPDIDVDFCMDNRDRIIDYVKDKYGENSVAQIITFGKMLAKGVIRDVGRALDMPYSEVDAIAKLVPADPKITLAQALAQEPKLRDLAARDEKIKELIGISRSLEGLTRHASTHAAGVVIADKPLVSYLPLYRGTKGEVVTQYQMNDVDQIGLIKFDFLGLRTLTVIDKAVKLVHANPEACLPDINALPLDDEPTYALLSSGETEGVFQLESSGMKDLLKRIRPSSIGDLTALLALYRPGPLGSGMVDDFISRKHGQTTVSYDLPELEQILKETYGVILYQEQVMRVASALADFSLADADLLRRAMGKKKASEMAKQKEKFLAGARNKKINAAKAEKIFDLMAKFAEYGFNKSHSAAYAYVSYQTAYLKAHYPVAFMAALLSCEMDNTDKVVKHIAECREKNLGILPPDVNASVHDFTVTGDTIRFGLAAVKNVGAGAIESIIEARTQDGPFTSLLDCCTRIDLRKANRKVIESLIQCGAFDSLGRPRAQQLAVIDAVIAAAQRRQKDRLSNQLSMFEILAAEGSDSGVDEICYPDLNEWEPAEMLRREKESLGFYITGHPLDDHRDQLVRFTTTDIATALSATSERTLILGGMLSTVQQKTTRNGEQMAIATLEDPSGSIELLVFPKTYRTCSELLQPDIALLVQGQLKIENESRIKLLADAIVRLDDGHLLATPEIHLQCSAERLTDHTIDQLKQLLDQSTGSSPVFLHVRTPRDALAVMRLGEQYYAPASQPLLHRIQELLGPNSVSIS